MEVCRLCLDLVATQGEAKLFDGETRDMVQVVAPELNLEASKEPHACAECQRTLTRLFEFKSRVFEREAEVRAAVGTRRGKFGLKEALEGGDAKGTPSATTDPGGGDAPPKAKDRVCRTCLAPIECESFTVLRPSEPDAYLSSMLDVCLVEVDLELTLDPVMCEACLEQLQRLHHFRSACRDAEEKIVAFREGGGAGTGPVDLHAVLGAAAAAATDVEMVTVKEEDEGAASSSRAVPRRGGRKRVKVEPAKVEPVKEEEEDEEDDESEEEEDDEDEDMSEGDEDDPDDELKQEELDIKSETGTSDSDRRTCSLCGHTARSKSALKGHMLMNHNDGDKYFCPCCDYKSDRCDNVVRHFACGVHRLNLSCGLCGHSAADRQSLTDHFESSHRSGDLYCCPHCDHTTKYRANIRIHVHRVHNRCQLCNVELDSRADHRRHMALVHGKKFVNDRLYHCDRCPFQCKNMYTLKRHRMEVHGDTDVPMYKCSRCEYSSPKKYAVNEHEKVVHDGQRNLGCEYCEYSTREKMNLAVHLHNKHGVGEVPYLQCPHCPYRNMWRKNVTAHVRMRHEGMFRHYCKECLFTTNDSNSYKAHRVRVHDSTTAKVFQCVRCSYSSLRKHNLSRHEQTVHDNVRFKCEFCPYTSKEMARVKKHTCPGAAAVL